MLRLAPGEARGCSRRSSASSSTSVSASSRCVRGGRARCARAAWLGCARGRGVDRVGGVDEEPARLPRRMAPVVS
jgi:hypothetical protein